MAKKKSGKKSQELHSALLTATDNLAKKEREVEELRKAVGDATRHAQVRNLPSDSHACRRVSGAVANIK